MNGGIFVGIFRLNNLMESKHAKKEKQLLVTAPRLRPLVMVIKFVTVIGQISPNRAMTIRSVLIVAGEILLSRMEILNHASCVT